MSETTETAAALSAADQNRRQVLYWRLLAQLFSADEQPALETASVAIVDDIGLPPALLDPSVSVDTVVQRFPELATEFRGLMAPGEGAGAGESDGAAAADAADEDSADHTAPDTPADTPADGAPTPGGDTADHTPAPVGGDEVRRAALVSKLLLNVFATGSGDVSAGQLSDWQADSAWLERGMGAEPGCLRSTPGGAELAGAISDLEGDLVQRMRLREVLADSHLAGRLTPSMSLVEQLLRDKSNLSGAALANAKALIRRFVDEVAEVLRTQVQKASVGAIDRSVPPKRVFRNLDLDRTIWKNLTNWSPEEQKLYVDRLYFRQTARRITPARLVVVVDQSGSMVDSMVNCTILASIFAGLPKVDVHLVAYDTRAIDLTPWAHDPFETLMRTQLGGGTNGEVALEHVRPKIEDPRNTVVVWISDFEEWNAQTVFEGMQAIHRSGARFIPVGSVSSGGRQHVNPWFRERFKDMDTPVLSGHIRKLVSELKNFLT
ncbi:hypothetical protein GCM10027570_45660 [Streptomonospora sediminis]